MVDVHPALTARREGPTRERGSREAAVLGLSVLWGVLAVAGYATLLHPGDQIAVFQLAPWLLALGFGIAESAAVRLRFGRSSHWLTMGEIALALGLFFCSAAELLIAQLMGTALALLMHRRPPLIVVSHLTTHAAGAVLAIMVFRWLVPESFAMSASAWLGALAGCLAYTLVTNAGRAVVAMLLDGTFSVRLAGIALVIVAGVANSSLGLVTVSIVLDGDPKAAWLLIIPTGALYLAYLAYTRERDKHQSLEFVFESSRILSRNTELEQAIVALLQQARAMFHGDVAEVLFTQPDGTRVSTRLDSKQEIAALMAPVTHPADEALWDAVAKATGPLLVDVVTAPPDIGRYLTRHRLSSAIIARLAGDAETVGVLVVADREGTGSASNKDLRLFESFASQVSVALENDRLEQSLSQQRELEQRLTRLAYYDPLTRLANRSLFTDRVVDALRRTRQDGRACAVMFIDLDDFKAVNDTLGHAAGDELLTVAAQRISSCLRPGDFSARLGGDEFAALIDDALPLQAAEGIAARIIDALHQPIKVAGAAVEVRASIGIATSHDAATCDDLLRNADLAMYLAKENGKGCYQWFREDMRADVARRAQLKSDLTQAAELGQIQVYYQPVVDISSGRPVGAEALVRWLHPERGLVLPSSFLPEAQNSGTMREIGRLVLRDACQQVARWSQPGLQSFTVGVNVSAAQFVEPGLPDDVEEALSMSGIDASCLILEVSEDVIHQRGTAQRTLDRLHALGVQLAIGNFGAGNGSLADLRRTPATYIKIAKTFTDELLNEEADGRTDGARLVRGIVELGGALGLICLAEGIEHRGQARMLYELGCRLGQGYYFGRPLPAAGIDTLLSRAVPS